MFGKALVFVALAATAIAQTLQVNSPASLITCQPALLSWSGGKSPYFLSVIPGGQPSAAALKDFGQQSGTSYTWNVDLAAGTSVTVKIVDSDGNTNYAAPVSIQTGSTSCLNGGGASGSASSAAGSATSGAASSAGSAAATTSAAGAVSSASAAASSAAASAASGASSVRSAAASGASSASGVVASGASAASSAAASATGAALPGAVVNMKTGLLGAALGIAGLLL